MIHLHAKSQPRRAKLFQNGGDNYNSETLRPHFPFKVWADGARTSPVVPPGPVSVKTPTSAEQTAAEIDEIIILSEIRRVLFE